MLKVVKIGGNVVDNPQALDRFLADFAALPGPRVLVHGGGKIASEIGRWLGIEPRMIDGRRVTDAETLRVVTMVYAGLINKTIVGKLQALGCNAVGLSGIDGALIPARRRSPDPIDYGFVGDSIPERFGLRTAATLIDAGYTLVVAPITMNETDGSPLNTNADTVAQAVAVGLAGDYEVELVYCFEKPGVLRDPADDTSVIPRITPQEFESLKADKIVTDGMIPKLENAFRAIASGVHSVAICGADALTQPGYGGTILQG